MIPVSLYGLDVEKCEAFYAALPDLVADTVDDEIYADALFSIESEASLEHIRVADCLLYTSPSPRDGLLSRMPSSA